jgi:hypothetical protein
MACIDDRIVIFFLADLSLRPGQTLSSRLLMCLKMRCSAVLFDPVLNSVERMLLTAHQAFLFIARLFHSFVLKLPAPHRVPSNPDFFFKTVQQIPFCLRNYVGSKLRQLGYAQNFPLPLADLQLLNTEAFLYVVHPCPGYRAFKKQLKARRLSLKRKLGEKVAVLQNVAKAAEKTHLDVVLLP